MNRTAKQLLEKTRGLLEERRQEALNATEGVPDSAYQVSPFVITSRVRPIMTSPAFYWCSSKRRSNVALVKDSVLACPPETACKVATASTNLNVV